MVAANYTTVRNKLKEYCDMVSDDNEVVIVTRKDEKNVVIISLDKFNEYEKEVRNAQYLAKIERGFKQIRNGRGQEHELIEVDD